MGSFSTDDASEDDDGVVASVEHHLMGAVDKFKATGDGLHVDILGEGSMLLECAHAAAEECSGYLRVPFSNNNPEAHVTGIGNVVGIVIRKIVQCCSHNG